MESVLNNIKLKFDNDGFIVNENLINQVDLEAIEKWISELNDSSKRLTIIMKKQLMVKCFQEQKTL